MGQFLKSQNSIFKLFEKSKSTAHNDVNTGRSSAMILLTLQWTDDRQVINFMKKVSYLTPDFEYVFLPRFWDKKSTRMSFPVNVRFEKKYDFYSMLRLCDIHVTTYSTTAIEAPFFEKPNILLDFNGMTTKYFGGMLDDSRFTKYVLTAGQFIHACKMFLDSPETISFESYKRFEVMPCEERLVEVLHSLKIIDR